MSARKFTAALFEHVDYKAQAAEIAKHEEAKQRQKQRRQLQPMTNKSLSGLLSRIFWRSPPRSGETDSKAAPDPGVSYPRVLLFGDSLTQYAFGVEGGWGAMLADKLQRRADVVVRGFSGYNTRWCRSILDQIFTVESPSLLACVVILLGSNDASLPDLFPKTHVPVEEYESNLSFILEELTDKFGVDKRKIILVTPPPVNRNMLEDQTDRSEGGEGEGGCSESSGAAAPAASAEYAPQPVAYTNESTSRYAAACRRVGDAADVSTLDLFSAMLGKEPVAAEEEDGGEGEEEEEKNGEEAKDEEDEERDERKKGGNIVCDDEAFTEDDFVEGNGQTRGEAKEKLPDVNAPTSSSLAPNEPTWYRLFCDGIHFSRLGSEFFFRRLWPLVDQRVETLPFKYPHWRHVDEIQPFTSLRNGVDVWDKDFKFD